MAHTRRLPEFVDAPLPRCGGELVGRAPKRRAVGGGFGDFKVHVDGTDYGRLKFTAYNFAASPDTYTVVIWARASRAITTATHLIG